jgi:hypothetical protein
MAFRVPFILSWVAVAGTLLFGVHGAINLAISAEIVVESVKPTGSPATPVRYGVTREDFRRLSSVLPGADYVVPVREMAARAVRGERQLAIRFIGTTPEYTQLDKLTLEQGRFLMQKDLDNRNNIAVVDTATAQHLFPGGQAIGENIRVSGHYFLIVGLLAAEPEPSSDEREVPRVLIPLTTMQSRFGDTVLQTRTGSLQVERYELSRIHVVMETAASWEQGASVTQSLMNEHHEKRDYSVRKIPTSVRD